VRASVCATGSVFVLWFAGCGGTTAGNTGSGTARTYCEAEAVWRERCRNETCGSSTVLCPPDGPCPPPAPQPCSVSNLTCDTAGAQACLERIFRPEALTQMRDCELALPCNGGKEHCIEVVSLPDPSPAMVAFTAACERRQQECVGQFTGSDSNFFCFDLSPMKDDYIALYQECLNGTCDSIRGCMDGGKFDAFCAM
jgi:hypothetical protein